MYSCGRELLLDKGGGRVGETRRERRHLVGRSKFFSKRSALREEGGEIRVADLGGQAWEEHWGIYHIEPRSEDSGIKRSLLTLWGKLIAVLSKPIKGSKDSKHKFQDVIWEYLKSTYGRRYETEVGEQQKSTAQPPSEQIHKRMQADKGGKREEGTRAPSLTITCCSP